MCFSFSNMKSYCIHLLTTSCFSSSIFWTSFHIATYKFICLFFNSCNVWHFHNLSNSSIHGYLGISFPLLGTMLQWKSWYTYTLYICAGTEDLLSQIASPIRCFDSDYQISLQIIAISHPSVETKSASFVSLPMKSLWQHYHQAVGVCCCCFHFWLCWVSLLHRRLS